MSARPGFKSSLQLTGVHSAFPFVRSSTTCALSTSGLRLVPRVVADWSRISCPYRWQLVFSLSFVLVRCQFLLLLFKFNHMCFEH